MKTRMILVSAAVLVAVLSAGCENKLLSAISADVRIATAPRNSTIPYGSIVINGGLAATNVPLVSLNIPASDDTGLDKMWLSNLNGFTTGAWESYSSTVANWDLRTGVTSSDGTKTVYVKFKDADGNESSVYSASIKYDTTKPTGASVRYSPSVGFHPDYITNPYGLLTIPIRLELSATDATSGVSNMMISEQSNFSGASWAGYSAVFTGFPLSSEFGIKTIYAKFQDAVQFESTAISTIVILDDQYEGNWGNSNGEDPYTLFTTDTANSHFQQNGALMGQLISQDYAGYAVLNDDDNYWLHLDYHYDSLTITAELINGIAGTDLITVNLFIEDGTGSALAYASGPSTVLRTLTYSDGGNDLTSGWYTVRIGGSAGASRKQYNLTWSAHYNGM